MFTFFGKSELTKTRSSANICAICAKPYNHNLLAKCPKCGRQYCGECATVDHIMRYTRINATPNIVMSVAVRCPSDRSWLVKANVDPYISHLAEIELQSWDRPVLDPKRELANKNMEWSDGAISLARRYVAMGMTFHPGPSVTFGILGAALWLISGKNADIYLQQCAKDFAGSGFRLEQARLLCQEFVVTAELNNMSKQKLDGLMIARQFMRQVAKI